MIAIVASATPQLKYVLASQKLRVCDETDSKSN